MLDPNSLVTLSAVYLAISAAIFVFRVERELLMEKSKEIQWIPWADVLPLAAGALTVTLGIVPLLLAPSHRIALALSTAASAASSVLIVGYVPSILSHYRIWFRGRRRGAREKPEPAEQAFVIASLLVALIALMAVFLLSSSVPA